MAKPRSRKEEEIKPFFGSGVLVDSFRMGESGKVDVSGVFTILYAWSIPFTRSFNAVLTIFNLPKGETLVDVSISKRRSRRLKPLGRIKASPKEKRGDIIVPYIIKNKFEEEGVHEIIFSFQDYPGKLRLPLDIQKKNGLNLPKQN